MEGTRWTIVSNILNNTLVRSALRESSVRIREGFPGFMAWVSMLGVGWVEVTVSVVSIFCYCSLRLPHYHTY